MKFKNKLNKLITLMILLSLVLSLAGCTGTDTHNNDSNATVVVGDTESFESGLEEIPSDESIKNTKNYNYEDTSWNELGIDVYKGNPYVTVNSGNPFFTSEDKANTEAFEIYSELDSLERCGVAYANICEELMPTEDRGAIGQVKPSGWQSIKYDIVDGKYLYNRCHLIGFQLAGENANELNLITGTRYLNIDGMLDHENMIADYVKSTGNHVLYRVTPMYKGDNLVASGVLMEAYSVEDSGDGLKFCIYAYNVQPGVQIDYATGKSSLIGDVIEVEDTSVLKNYVENSDGTIYTVNIETKKFHYEDCGIAIKTKDENKESYNGTIDWLLDNGYEPCGKCKPQ